MEYKIMTREELEYMMIDLHVICLMKDEEIKTLKDKNEMLEDRKEYLRKKYNESVLLLEKEKEQLKKQIDELIYENSELGKFNIHMYVREQEKLMRENEQLRRQIDDLSDTCSEQLETIATLQKANNNQERTIKNQEARILIKDTQLENLKINLKKAREEKEPKFDDSVDCKPRKQ